MKEVDSRSNWRGFLVGCLLLGGLYWLLGWAGIPESGVIRRNREMGLSASPLFYTEVADQTLFQRNALESGKGEQTGK